MIVGVLGLGKLMLFGLFVGLDSVMSGMVCLFGCVFD